MKVLVSFSDCIMCPGSFGLEYCLCAEMLIGLWVMRNMGCSWDYPCKGFTFVSMTEDELQFL